MAINFLNTVAVDESVLFVDTINDRVGVGTSTPGSVLDVQGTQGQLFSVTDDLSGEIFAVSDISGVPIMTVNSSGVSYFDGNVGIGTTSPTAPLDVNGVIRSRGGSYSADTDTRTDVGLVIPENDFIYTADGSDYLRKLIGKNNDVITIGESGTSLIDGINLSPGTTGGYVQILNNASIAAKFVNGRLGIGNTSPQSKLHVDGGVALINVSDDWQQSTLGTNLIRGGNFNDTISEESTSIKIFPADDDRTIGDYWGGIGFMHLDPENSGWGTSYTGEHFWIGGRVIDQPGQERSALVFATNNSTTAGTHSSEKMVILPNGNVGIGTTNPQNTLHLGDSSNSAAGTLRLDSFVANQFWKLQPGTNTLSIKDYDGTSLATFNGDSNYVLFNGGNVGIGTTSPTADLHVQGSSEADVPILRVGGFGNSGSKLELAETLTNGDMNYGFSFFNDGNSSNTLIIKAHNNSTTGTTAITINRTDALTTFSTVPIVGTRTAGDNSTYAASTAFVAAAIAGVPQGDITSVIAGTGLTGGGTTGDVTLNAIGGNGITANANDIEMSGDYTGSLRVTEAVLSGTTYSDPDLVLAITDQDTTLSLRDKMTGSSALTKVDDSTAPAPGCFQVSGAYYPQGFGPYYKISEGDEFTFEFWVKWESGDSTSNLLYAGSNFYNAAGTYLGNSQRYWGESGLQINVNTPSGWTHVSGTLGPDRGNNTGDIPTTAEKMKLLFLFNYNPSGTSVTRYCGLKVYKSNPTVTKLYRKTTGSEAGSTRNRDLVIDSNGDITANDLTVQGDAIVSGNVKIVSALLSNQENTDIDSAATEVVAQVAHATYTAAFFDFVVKKGTNVRSGTIYACHDGTNVEFTETSTNDLGDTSDVTLSVDVSGANMRLLATVTSDDWSVKSLIRAI